MDNTPLHFDRATIAREGRSLEWLEADGLGGFASGTINGLRTRRYHALLLTATDPPVHRVALVNGLNAWLETDTGSYPLSSQLYGPDYVAPDALPFIAEFISEPWPAWTFALSETCTLRYEIFVPHESSTVVLSWKIEGTPSSRMRLHVRPFFSGRDFHSLHHENAQFRFAPASDPDAPRLRWQFYDALPAVVAETNGAYAHDPHWYRNFLYTEEYARGLDSTEELASPGMLEFDLAAERAILIFSADGFAPHLKDPPQSAEELYARFSSAEKSRRAAFPSPLHRAADAFFVQRGKGRSLIAGYPWFGEWGRDTFVALRGLCLATDRLQEAHDILGEWAGAVSQGMMPNRFPDRGEPPEYNSADAALWYIVAVHEFLEKTLATDQQNFLSDVAPLLKAVEDILSAYCTGTRYGIHRDEDGLLACGEIGMQLTWMDARIGNWVVTPRIGKPVEVEALWINALWIAMRHNPRWKPFYETALASFTTRFWNPDRGCLYDVVDAEHQPGACDASLRPNQIFAIGGLPLQLLDPGRAAAIVKLVEEKLWTPLGLRTLAPGEFNYCPHYEGNVIHRDGSYHQGTVWPWLAGPFIEAWLRVHGNTLAAKAEAHNRFLTPLLEHLRHAGIGHVSEIADAEAPHTPRGCPFQAWSLSALLHLRGLLSQ
jgi:predicted glycogen debranching enzyme